MLPQRRSDEMRRMPKLRPAVVEGVAFVIAAALATVFAERQILFTRHVYQSDALLLEYWMRRFQDPQLFTDPLTHALIHTAYVPIGVEGLYRVASYLMDPIRFGAWGAVVLAPFSAFLVFRIIREHTAWIPAAWLGAALFLLPWSTERFGGTHARAFGQPIVLLTVYLMLRGRIRWAAVVPPVGALFYPPASILAAGVLAAAALGRKGRRPAIDRTLATTAALSVAATLAALLAPRLAGVPTGHLISESAARHYPEFGPHGQLTFFRKSVWQMLRGRYSGFDLKAPGSILLTAAVAMLALRPSNARLVRREIWVAAAVSLILFGVSYTVLFHLYLPNRYTHPLTPVYCIMIGVCWRPTWCALGRRIGASSLPVFAVGLPAAIVWIGVIYLRLGPQWSRTGAWRQLQSGAEILTWSVLAGLVLCIAAILRERRNLARGPLMALGCAIFSGALLVGAATGAYGGRDYTLCEQAHLQAYLRSLPQNAIIAGDPVMLDCVPIESERAVVISRKLYQPVDANYLKVIRPRMFAMLGAYYGASRRAIANLYSRYGADYLVVQRSLLTARQALPPYRNMAPFEKLINTLLSKSSTRAALGLPATCAAWRHGELTVYDLRCVSRSVRPVAAGQRPVRRRQARRTAAADPTLRRRLHRAGRRGRGCDDHARPRTRDGTNVGRSDSQPCRIPPAPWSPATSPA
jgi:hypothetical protein